MTDAIWTHLTEGRRKERDTHTHICVCVSVCVFCLQNEACSAGSGRDAEHSFQKEEILKTQIFLLLIKA